MPRLRRKYYLPIVIDIMGLPLLPLYLGGPSVGWPCPSPDGTGYAYIMNGMLYIAKVCYANIINAS